MAKNFSKGIDNVFNTTTKMDDVSKKTSPAPSQPENKKVNENYLVAYNLRYPKDLQKRIKRFCIENDGIDMKDVFTQGAILFMNQYHQ
jgi:hypothetical protein